MKTETILTFEDYISPLIRVIIKNKTEIITNKIYPKNFPFKSILVSEGLPSDSNYIYQNSIIDINKPIIELVSQKIDEITDLELVIESEDILDISEYKGNKPLKDTTYHRILCPYEKPFRILLYIPQENNVSIKKYDKDTLMFFGLNKFALSKSGYCNTFNDLFIANGEGNFFKVNNIKLNIEKIDNIPWEKKYHSMIYIPNKYIYFIGGNTLATFYYEFINKIFKLWAPMKYKEKNPGLIYVNKTYIYAFGHPKKLDDLNFIERTDIKRKPKWDVINIKLSEPFNLKRFATVLSKDEKIYFVGGKKVKEDKIFFFDLKNNEISKTTQINTGMKIYDSNFYNINEFTTVVIPQETNGDIKFIAFNQRTKKFRKLRYERDFDLINENKILEINEDNMIKENMKITAEINIKKLENKFKNEKLGISEIEQEEEANTSRLKELKKLLLGDKNILSKNVEAMIFNRKRVKNKKFDKIDGDESENDYDYFDDFEEDDIMSDEDKNDYIIIDDDQDENQNNLKMNLRSIPNRNGINDNSIDKKSNLRNIFEQDINDKIDILNVKNPRITLDDYNNLMYYNKISSSYIFPKPNYSINYSLEQSNEIKINNDSPFKFNNNDNKFQFNLTGKKRNIQETNIQPNKKITSEEPEIIKENINNIKDQEKNIIDNNNIEPINIKIPTININKNIPTPGLEDKNSNTRGFKLVGSENEDYIMNATIKGQKTSLIGEKNFEQFGKDDTHKSLTLKELFGGDVDDKIILNSGVIIVPEVGLSAETGRKSKIINKDDKNIIEKKSEIEKPEEEIEDVNKKRNELIITDKPEININTRLPKIEISANEMNNNFTLKEFFGKDVDDKIDLNVLNPELWDMEIDSYVGIIKGKPKTSLNIKESNNNLEGTQSGLNKNISVFDGELNKNNIQNEIKTLKELFGEELNDKINLNIIKQPLWPIDIKTEEEIKESVDLQNDAEVSYYTEMKPISTLKEEFGQDINDKIDLKVKKSKLWDIENNNYSLITNKSPIDSNTIGINNNNININKSSLNFNISTPDINIKENKGIILEKTLKEIFGEELDDNINLNIKKQELWPIEKDISGLQLDLDTDTNKKMKRTLNSQNEYNKNNVSDLGNADISIYTIMKPSTTLREEFGKDIDGDININLKKIKLNQDDINTTNNNETSFKLSNNIEISGTDINIPKVKLSGTKPNINGSIPEIEIELKKPKQNIEFNPSITLKEIFNEDIDEPYNLNIKKLPLEPDSNNDFSDNISCRKFNLKIESPTLKISLDNINPEINKQEPDIQVGEIPEIDTNIKLENIKIKKPELDINLKLDNDKNKIDNITLKQIFSDDINDEIKLNVKKQELWDVDNYYKSGILNGKNNKDLTPGDINIILPNVDIPKITLTGSCEEPKITDSNNIKGEISGSIPGIQINKPEIDLNLNIPSLNNNLKPEYDPNVNLKEICSKDIDDNIKLNIIKPELWDIESNNLNLSGQINGKVDIKFPSANINIKQPDINISKTNPKKLLESSINKPEINISGPLRGAKVDLNIKNPEIKFDINKSKADLNNNNITLKEIFNGDVEDKIKLKVIKPKLWGTNENKSLKNNLYRSTNPKFPKRNVDMNDPNINNILNYSLKDSFNNQYGKGNLDIKASMPNLDIDMNKPKINVDIKKPKLDLKINNKKLGKIKNDEEKNSITLKQLFNEDIDDKIYLNVIKPELWDINDYNNSGLINGNFNINIPKGKININRPKIDINGFNNSNINLNENIPEINLNEPNIKTNLRAPKLDTNIRTPSISISGMKLGNEKNNGDENTITLKQIFNEDINDEIKLNVVKPELWDVNNYNITGLIDGNLNLNLPEGNININGPKINVPNYSLKDINTPNINIKSDIPGIKLDKPNIKADIKNPNIEIPTISIEQDNLGNKKESSVTLKNLCNGGINDEINLNVVKPELWDVDNYNNSGLIDGNINIKLPQGDFNINKLDLNIPDYSLKDINKPNINIEGEIPGININQPKISMEIKSPTLSIPEPNIDQNNKENENEIGITLKEIFNKDINDDIKLNIIKPDLWDIENYKISGLIDGNLDLKSPKGNIIINGPDINLPNYSLKGNIKKPKIETDINGELNGGIPDLNINKPNVNGNINVQQPNIDIEINQPNLDDNIPGISIDINGKNKNKHEKLSTTLKDVFNEDINENINLNIIKPALWGIDELKLSGIIEGENNGNKLPSSDINIKGPKLDTPDMNIGNINIGINGEIPDIEFNINEPKIDADIDINGNIPALKKPDIEQNYEFVPSVTLKEEFGKDIDDNIFNINIKKLILEKDKNISIDSNEYEIPEFDIPNINLKGKKPDININSQIPDINLDVQQPNINKLDLGIKINPQKQSRNQKRIIEETISGEIPGKGINKLRTEVYSGEIPGIKINKINKAETVQIPNSKQSEINIIGIIPGSKIKNPEIDIKKPEIETNISGPNIKIDKDLPEIEMDNFDIGDIELEEIEPSITLKNLFAGDINKDDINLNKIKPELWDVENINPFNTKNENLTLKSPTNKININKPNVYYPEVNLSEFDSDLKNPDIKVDVNQPKLKAEIDAEIPDLKVNNELDIDEIIDNLEENEIDLQNEKINLESNRSVKSEIHRCTTLKELFSKEIDDKISLNIKNNRLSPEIINMKLNDKTESHRNINSNLNIDIKDNEINIPNIELKGIKTNLRAKNEKKINNDINKDEPKIKIELNQQNINNEIKEINAKLPMSTNTDLKPILTLKDIFNQNIDDNIELNLKRLDLIRRNNTLYISGQKDPINYYPTDDISIKGPNLNSNFKYSKKVENNKIDNKSEISIPNANIQNKSSESEIIHNIPNNFSTKIKLPIDKENIIINLDKSITLKELFSEDINDEIKLKLIYKNQNLNNIYKGGNDIESVNYNENIQDEIMPKNIDIKYEIPTNSCDIKNISPSKLKENQINFNKSITLRELFNMNINAPVSFSNTQIDYNEIKIEEEKNINDDDFEFPSEDEIKDLNSITSGLNKKKIYRNIDNNNIAIEPEEKNGEEDSFEYI